MIEPKKDERPAIYADRLGQDYASSSSIDHKKNFGQYITPVEVADFMSLQLVPKNTSLKILDPGAGTGVLSCSLCETLCRISSKITTIELVAYESDKCLLPYLEKSFDYLCLWLKARKVILNYHISNKDFVLDNANALGDLSNYFGIEDTEYQKYDFVISNPPYFKIPKSDQRAKVAASVVHGQPNIYALFMAISASLLKKEGELVFITPRSFTAGPYFRLFRERFFSMVKPKFLHLFGSRYETFDRDSILQENIIIKAQKDGVQHKGSYDDYVIISFSEGLKDLQNTVKRKIKLSEIIDLESKNKVLHIPISLKEENVIKLVQSWEGNLHDYGMEISTGPVVPFRATVFIAEKESQKEPYAPLLWMQNVKPMIVQWPISTRKQQYIKICQESTRLLVPNKNYVLLRRFSAKEQGRRLVAAPYSANTINTQLLGLENHLNYIYRPKGELSPEEIYGLSALYNCSLLDQYFRTFNGNTQVSAIELRGIPLPPLDLIKSIGRYIMSHPISNGELDIWISEILSSGQEKVTIKEVEIYG